MIRLENYAQLSQKSLVCPACIACPACSTLTAWIMTHCKPAIVLQSMQRQRLIMIWNKRWTVSLKVCICAAVHFGDIRLNTLPYELSSILSDSDDFETARDWCTVLQCQNYTLVVHMHSTYAHPTNLSSIVSFTSKQAHKLVVCR